MHKIFLFTVTAICFCISALCQTTYYVDASRANNSGAGTTWATAKKDLQIALNMAIAGDQVWVRSGTYLPTHDPFGSTAPANNRDKTFSMKNGVRIYGGFAGSETQLSQRNRVANVTILSGDLGVTNTLSDNAYHVVLAVGIGGSALLDGFTITKGYAVSPQSSITVSGRIIERHNGGGIFNTNTGANFSNCIITQNSADCTDGNDDARGAGILTDNSSSAFTNCRIDGNSFLSGGGSFGVFGAGMCVLTVTGVSTIVDCSFINNTSGSGFFDGSKGGALYLSSGAHDITNTIFYNNSSQNGAAISSGGGASNTSTVTNCTFANNTSSFAGTAFSGFGRMTFRNSIFWNNVPTVSPVAGRNEILSQETTVANQPIFTNCIIRDATGSPLSVTNAKVFNSLNTNPLFVNIADADGADNTLLTGDDGLQLQCSSPAINAGAGSIPILDILGLARTAPLDIGAYEGNYSNAALNTIPSTFTSVTASQPTSGVGNYSDCSAQVLAIQSGGSYTLSGQTTASVWIEASQPTGAGGTFVKRHYQINTVSNASTATARVTLFFTQQEFNDFNAVSTIDLPTGAADATGKSNLLIEKRPGVSSNGTGLPGTYTGPALTIDPVDTDIIWNNTANRWEVSFDVNGFSGFFVKTQLTVLPLRIVHFSASKNGSCSNLKWRTEDEINTGLFELEKSSNGFSFNQIAALLAVGTGKNSYQHNDCTGAGVKSFYRLKMIDKDGRFSYSSIIQLDNKPGVSVSSYPNPATNVVLIKLNDISLLNSRVLITDVSGRQVMQDVLAGSLHSLNIERLPQGIYQLQFENGSMLRMKKVK